MTDARRALAARLTHEATAELQQLAMPNAELTVVVQAGQLGPEGADEVAILLAAHPGATPAPVSKAASGGELSRIMLALEVVLADTDAVGRSSSTRLMPASAEPRPRPSAGGWRNWPSGPRSSS